MDLNYTEEEIAFRDEVRAFLDEKLPKELSDKVAARDHLGKEDMERWHAILNEKGWLAPNWPKKFGGAEWNAVQKHIFEEETARANAPRIVPFGLSMLAPVLQAFGSKEQQDYYLPRILSGEDWWCQGYSEPGAGSDLASLKTRAVRDGDHYIVNGQKTWTTLGQYANKIFCLVRTDPDVKQQEGISFLLIDMDTPGIEVRPIILLDGVHEVNEVFFDDVKVPVENLVGEENKGWTYAKYLLTHERTNIAGVGYSQAGLESVKRIARAERANGKPLIVRSTSRQCRNRPDGDGHVEHAHHFKGCRRSGAGRGILDAQGQGYDHPARDQRSRPPRGWPLRDAFPLGNRRRRQRPDRTGLRGACFGCLFQQPQAVDLWRLERDPARDHRQSEDGRIIP